MKLKRLFVFAFVFSVVTTAILFAKRDKAPGSRVTNRDNMYRRAV